MRKQKINFKKYADMHDSIEITGKDGTVIHVRTHIPYADKVEMVTKLIENGLMVHDDSCIYEGHAMNAERIKAIFKYYTDVQVDDIPAEEVADFAINNELINQIRDTIHDDYYEAEDILILMQNEVIDTFDDDRSIRKAVRTSFGFLFNGEDITQSLAKAEMTKNTMFNALDALNKKEEQEQTKLNSGKMKVGNNIVNFSKRG